MNTLMMMVMMMKAVVMTMVDVYSINGKRGGNDTDNKSEYLFLLQSETKNTKQLF